MDNRTREAFQYLEQIESKMIHSWNSLVSIESVSTNRESIDHIIECLRAYAENHNMDTEIWNTLIESGSTDFVARTQPGSQKPVALLGHIDTVHPTGSFGEDTFQIKGDFVTGPGVLDCKGGVIAALYAIDALCHIGYHDRQIKLILSSDEEVAHSLSDGRSGLVFEEEAKGCAAAFNVEPGSPDGEITLQRKGGAMFEIEVFGKAAHAGKEPEKGANAIRQAAEMICQIENATVLGETTYNCGVIQGGKGANVVPDYCRFDVGVRYNTNEQYQKAREMIQALCDAPVVKGTHCSMKQNGFYPALEPTEKSMELFSLYKKVCKEMDGSEPGGIAQGGCSDSAFAAKVGVPTLCGMGVHGSGAHSLSETAKVSSLLLQAKRLTALILALPKDF